MTSSLRRIAVLALFAATIGCGRTEPKPASSEGFPAPPADAPPIGTPPVGASPTARPGRAVAVVAGGCFWGIEAVYRHTRGVTRAVSGYAGGTAETANYEVVSSGLTDHAEAVEVTYDPSVVTYSQILRIFFEVAHDPTELNRQGPDVGRQYRSAIFAANKEQERVARAYVAELDRARVFSQPVATEISALTRFYPAEAYHQNYAALHPNDMYIRINDAPKVEALRQKVPELFVLPKSQ